MKQPEVLAYLQHITERYDLRKDMYFETELTSAQWTDSESRWVVETSTGNTFHARYLVTALGLLSKRNFPDIPGIDTFQGEMYHTGSWPADVDLTGKRVGIIGNGSTGVQVITAIAPQVKQLVTFQRNPQYSVPSGDGPVSQEYRDEINEKYPEIWREALNNSMFAFGFEESDIPTFSVSPEEREEIFETAWQKGGGFRFMFGTFNDITVNEDANIAACEFIKKKIRETVKDQEKARKLMPTQLFARRPLCDGGYYERFNQDNVDVVSVKETPIEEITSTGVKTSDKHYDLDVLIFATGFDAVDGNYTRLRIKGRNGTTLGEHWKPIGPTTYLGLGVSSFPNLFMITGPNGPFTNVPPNIETYVGFIGQLIGDAEQRKKEQAGQGGPSNDSSGPVVEVTKEAEQDWTKMCDEMSSGSLFRKTESWIFGANVKGKKHAVLFYFGGLKKFRGILKDVADDGYKGFDIKV